MSLLFLDSMSHYATADLAKKWTTVGPAVGTATLVVEPTGGRRGGGCLACTGGGSGAGYPLAFTPLATPTASGALGVAIKVTNLSGIDYDGFSNSASRGLIAIMDGNTCHLMFAVTSTGAVSVYRNAPAATVLLGTSSQFAVEGEWVHLGLEWTIHDTTGIVRIYNGVRTSVILELTGIDTSNGGSGNWTGIEFFGSLEVSVVRMCDLALMSTAGTLNNQYPGDRTVNKFVMVDDAFHADSTPSAGSDRFAMIDEDTPDGDTTHTDFEIAADADTYKVESLGATAAIEGIQLCACVKKIGDGSASVAARWRQNSTDHDTAAQAVTATDYTYHLFPYDENPETETAFALSEFGPTGDGEIGIVKET